MQDTISILNSINATVQKIATYMAPQNGSSEKAIAKLSSGNITNNSDVNPTAGDKTQYKLSTNNITDVVKALNMLSPGILNLAKISNDNINKFKNVLDVVVKLIEDVSKYAKNNKDGIESAKSISETLVILSKGINDSKSLSITAPIALLGIKLTKNVIDALIKIVDSVGNIDNIDDKIKNLNNITKVIDPIINLTLKATALVAICLGLGAVIMMGPTKTLILGGLAALGAIITASTAIILLAGFAGKVIKTVDAFGSMKGITAMIFASIALVAVCFGLGYAVDQFGGWEYLFKGIGVVATTFILLGFMFTIIGLTGNIAKTPTTLSGVGAILLLTVASFGIIFGAKYVGDFVLEHYDKILTGLGSVATIIMAILGIGKLASKSISLSKDSIVALGIIEGVAIGAMIVVVGAAKLAEYTNGRYGEILEGLGVVSSVLLALVGIGGTASKLLSSAKQGIISLGIMEGVAIGAMIVVAGSVKLSEYINGKYGEVIKGLGVVSSVLLALVGIGKVASKALDNAKKGIVALGILEALAIGATVSVGAIMALDYLKTKYNITWDDLYIDLLAIAGVITVFGGLATAAGAIAAFLTPGIAAMAGIEALALGSVGVSLAFVELNKAKKQNDISWNDIKNDIKSLTSILSTFGILALKFGVISPFVAAGSVALAAVEAMTVGVIAISKKLLELHISINSADVKMSDINTDVNGMTKIMTSFGKLAGKMSLLIVPIAVGTPGLVAVTKLANKIIGVINNLVNVSKAIKESGGFDSILNTVSHDIPAIMKNINMKNLGVDIGIKTMLSLGAKYTIVSGLVKKILTVAESISKISQIAGIVDDDGKLRSVLSINKETGEIRYGEPVDIKNLSTVISQSIKAFVENSQYSFRDIVNMYKAGHIFETLASITEPISKFVDMLTGYVSGDENTLARITIDEKGEIKIGQPVKVIDVANTVANTISKFVTEFYKKENTEAWSEIIYGDRTFIQKMLFKKNNRANSVREIAGVLGTIIEPICNFIDMLVGIEPVNGKLRKIVFDSEGNAKPGTDVDVLKVTGNIVSAISNFITAIYGENAGWRKLDEKLLKDNMLEPLLSPINQMIKIAEELSSDKIVPNVLNANSNAVLIANTLLFSSLTFESTKEEMDDAIGILTKIIEFSSSLSSNNISDEALRTKADSILYSNQALFKSIIPTVEKEKINDAILSLGKIIKLAESIGTNINSEQISLNSNAITTFMTEVVEKRFVRNTKTVDKFSNSVTNLKTSFKNLDTILIQDEEKREEALNKFQKKLSEIIKDLTDSKDVIESLNNLITRTQEYTPIGNRQQYVPTQQEQTSNNYNVTQNTVATQQTPSITSSDIENAIRNALAGLIIKNESEIMAESVEEAIKNITYKIQQ